MNIINTLHSVSRLFIFSIIILEALTACNADIKLNKNKASSNKPSAKTQGKHYDGPFGLAKGITQDELKKLGFKPDDDKTYLFRGIPPNPSNEFVDYYVAATEQGGLFRITLSSVPIIVNASGDQIKAKTDEVAALISQKYGRHTFKNSDIYKKYPEMWFSGLNDESVEYSYVWENGSQQLMLPNNLSSIIVKARSTDLRRGIVAVLYIFDNDQQCQQEIKNLKTSNL